MSPVSISEIWSLYIMLVDLFLICDEQIDWLILLCVLQVQLIGSKSRATGWHHPGASSMLQIS